MNKSSTLGLATIFAICLAAAGLILGLAFDSQGSVELLFSALALFLLKDTFGHSASPYFQEHHRAFQLMVTSFSLGFSIFLLVGVLELVFYANIGSYQAEQLIIRAMGGAVLTLGIGPYLSWVLKSRHP